MDLNYYKFSSSKLIAVHFNNYIYLPYIIIWTHHLYEPTKLHTIV